MALRNILMAHMYNIIDSHVELVRRIFLRYFQPCNGSLENGDGAEKRGTLSITGRSITSSFIPLIPGDKTSFGVS